MTGKPETPVDVFKRSVAAAMRAVSHDREMQVSYGPETPGLRGNKARLPIPGRDLPAEEVAQVRGVGDSFALRLRHHDAKVHNRLQPVGGTARAVFEAAEQARCEAIGTLAMAGVAKNLQAALEERCRARGYARVRDRSEAPLAEVVGLMVREKLTGAPIPESARRMVDLWRMSALGAVMSGAVGAQAQYANGLAALYLATGQDVACVAESAVGVTRMELREGGRLYVSVTLPNVIVGSVGGGTQLPSQSAALGILGLKGAGRARALAEVCAALCLAGEISIGGALCAGQFAQAHHRLSRRQP